MISILADIHTLRQHLRHLSQHPDDYLPKCCPHCACLPLWKHGFYLRQADRINHGAHSLNPIPILRYYCPHCRRTCSVLPECIPPRRWYLWETQQAALLCAIQGLSLRAISCQLSPSRHTIARWLSGFKARFLHHATVLRSWLSALGRTAGCYECWSACLKHLSLAQAMRMCHHQGVFIP